MVLNLALSYGSRQEIVRGVRELAGRVLTGELSLEAIDEDAIGASLYSAGLPDPDLVIRTSGEMRLSNFMLWQVAYSEIYVTDIPWPEFREDALEDALAVFRSRQRRFGLTGEQLDEEQVAEAIAP